MTWRALFGSGFRLGLPFLSYGVILFAPSPAKAELGRYTETKGGANSEVVTVTPLHGSREDFQLDGKGQLWRRWQEGSGNLTGWRLLDGWNDIRGFTVGKNRNGSLEIFATGLHGGRVFHVWQDDNSGTGWSPWTNLGEMTATHLTVVRNPDRLDSRPDGRLEVFARQNDGSVVHTWQAKANEGPWSQWILLNGEKGLSGPLSTSIDWTSHQVRLNARKNGKRVFSERRANGTWDGFRSHGERLEEARRLSGRLAEGNPEQALRDKQEEAGGYTPPPPPGKVECDRLKKVVDDSRIPSYFSAPGPRWARYTQTAVANIHWCNLAEVLDGFSRGCTWLDGFDLVRCNHVRRGYGCGEIRWGHRAEFCGPNEVGVYAAPPPAGEHSVPGTLPKIMTSSGFARQLRERPGVNPFDGGSNYEARPGAAPPPRPRIPELPEIEIAD